MKITTWNVNGIRAREAQVFDWVNREKPDILCLQEVKAPPAKVPPSLCELEGYWCYWHGHGGYSGVALHVNKKLAPVRPRFEHPHFDHESRIVTVLLGDVLVASIYVPNGGKDLPAKFRFLEAMDAFIDASHAAGLSLILCGDLNVARTERDVHPKLANAAQTGQTPEERALLERMLGRGLVDLGRHFDPDNDQLFTWWAPWRNMRERNIGWRLDYVLASQRLANKAVSCKAYREFGTSDHGPVTAAFDGPLFDTASVVAAEPPLPAKPASAPDQGQLGFDLFGTRTS